MLTFLNDSCFSLKISNFSWSLMGMNFSNFHTTKTTTDVLIIGSGAAGIRTAIELAQHNIDCLLIGKRTHGDAHTIKAAGGINASLGNLDPEDRWEIHAADTIREGHFINDPHAVETICKEAPQLIQELADWGCEFNRTEDGKINQRYFGAQSFRRTCFVGDRTGAAILDTLVHKAISLNVPYQQNIYITKIFASKGKAWGAFGYDMENMHFIFFQAKAIVLAAGGYSGIYKRHSSREKENTGDGAALAFDAGVSLQDMELVQFHPTGMVNPSEYSGTLVTEATRGEGGRLINEEGERFMQKYSPQKMELDARDVVSRAIFQEIEEGRGTKNDGIYLDISHEDPEYVKKRLPVIYKRFSELGIDITKEPMEIAPTAHYTMGGVAINFENGSTNIKGLYAIGEVTAGLHGANRLGGNSLLETVVLGKIVGKHLSNNLNIHEDHIIDQKLLENYKHWIHQYLKIKGKENPSNIIKALRNTMWKCAGIIRREDLLQQGLNEILILKKRSLDINLNLEKSDDFEDAFNLQWMLITAEAVLRSAILRTESRGAHFREDFPKTATEWRKNIICKKNEKGEMVLVPKDVAPVNDVLKSALDKKYSLNYHHLE